MLPGIQSLYWHTFQVLQARGGKKIPSPALCGKSGSRFPVSLGRCGGLAVSRAHGGALDG